MEIYVNNEKKEVASGTCLGDILAAIGMDAPGMAVAVDNKVVPRDSRAGYVLQPGARIIVVKAVCGG